jgi:hypothetical protein
MADGAEQPFSLVMAANAFEEIYGQVELGTPTPQPLERCTDVVVDGPDGPLLGHTEQWYAGDQGAVGIVIDVADDGPTVLAPVVAGTLPLVGINGFGVAVGAMSLSARDERIGIRGRSWPATCSMRGTPRTRRHVRRVPDATAATPISWRSPTGSRVSWRRRRHGMR